MDRFQAKKSLGQNFLCNESFAQRIVQTAGDLSHCVVLEVGPGLGSLTRPILKKNPAFFVCIEKDKQFAPILEELKAFAPDKFLILWEDALKINLADLYALLPPLYQSYKIKIISNLPYNVGTQLLIQWLSTIDNIDSLTLMFQKEVVERLIAKPHTKAYGRLSILAQWLCHITKVFDVPPKAFVPAPKVTSSVVHLVPKVVHEDYHLLPLLEKVTEAAFGKRRKMLRSSLKPFLSDEDFQHLNLNPTLRAENLTVLDFLKIVKWLKTKGF